MPKYKIKFGEKTFDASIYQEKIFDNVRYGKGNMVINACAGSSKTTTIVNCMDYISESKRIIFIAFNKEIVESIKNRVGKRDNTHICTFHSLGYSILRENFREREEFSIDEYKYSNYVKKNIRLLTTGDRFLIFSKAQKRRYVENIVQLAEYCRYFLAFTLKEIKKVAAYYGMDLLHDEAEVCRQVLIWGKENIGCIDHTDMVWLPNVLNLNSSHHVYDWVFIDEAQDTSIMEQKLVDKCFGRGCRFVAVGDIHQQINVWCGASKAAIEDYRRRPNTLEFLLPISYRCPKRIVELARVYSPNIEAAPDAEDGEVRLDVPWGMPNNGDMVLCRMTAPLIQLHLKYLRNNIKSYIRGSEGLRERFQTMIEETEATVIDRSLNDKKGLFSCLYRELIGQIATLKEKYGIDDEDALKHSEFLRNYDDVEVLGVLSEGLDTVDELRKKIDIVLSGNEKDGVQLTTVHRAKGLEADNVYLLAPSLLPLRYATKDWEAEAENNLVYVAITRAHKTFNYIKEERKYNLEYGFSLKDGMYTKLREAARKLGLDFTIRSSVTGTTETPGSATVPEKAEKMEKKKENAGKRFTTFFQ